MSPNAAQVSGWYTWPFTACWYLSILHSAPAPVLFHLHPLFASVGLYAIFGISILFKKRMKVRKHGYYMFLGVALGVLGTWIAYQDKSIRGKPHFHSTHAKIGLVSLILLVPSPLISWILLNPDSGWLVGNRSFRTIHTYYGKVTLLITFAAMAFGIAKYEKDPRFLAVLLTAMLSVIPALLL